MIEIKNITKKFKNRKILNDISIKFPNSGLFFIVGKSGVGKSTLLSILNGTLKCDSGKVLFNNKNIKDYKDHELFNKYFGIVNQSHNLLSHISAKENIKIACEIKGISYSKKIEEYAKSLEIFEILDNSIDILSGGEKQRVSILRALINDPNVLFLDEPTGALDDNSAKNLFKILKEISKNRLVIVVTHDEELASMYSENFIRLEENKALKLDFTAKNKDFSIKNNKKVANKISYKSIIRNNFLNNKVFELFKIFVFIFALVTTTISLSLNIYFNNSVKNIDETYLNYKLFEISKIEKSVVDVGNISLIKTKRPEKEELKIHDDFSKYQYFNNYKFFFLNSTLLKNETIIQDVIFEPHFEKTNDFIANKLFFDSYQNETFQIVFKASYETNIFSVNEENETFVFNENIENIRVKQVKNEFNYMNSKFLYYPYFYFENLLKTKTVYKFSNKTWFDLVEISNPNDEINSASLLFLCASKDEYLELNNQQNDEYKLTNRIYLVCSSFRELSSVITFATLIYSIVCLLSLGFIIGYCTYFEIQKDRKKIAILKTLGLSKSKNFNIYFLKNLISFAFALPISVLTIFLLRYLVDYLLRGFLLSNFLISYNFLFLFIAIILLIVFVEIYLINSVFNKIDIFKELKEE